MKKYIIDTNLVFSATLNLQSSIGQFILASNTNDIKFYAPLYLKSEIEKYIFKLVQISELEVPQVKRILELLYTKINFVDDKDIPFLHYKTAVFYVKDVDMNDLPFVTLNEFINGTLVTGDLELYNGLIAKGYQKVVTFKQLQTSS